MGDLALQNSEEVVLSVGNALEKKSNFPLKTIDLSNGIKISTVSNLTQKKLTVRSPSVKVCHTKPQSSITGVQVAKPVTNVVKVKCANPSRSSPLRVQNKSDTLNKICAPSPAVHTKLQQTFSAPATVKTALTGDLQGKTQCISFIGEQLPILSEVSDKTSQR